MLAEHWCDSKGKGAKELDYHGRTKTNDPAADTGSAKDNNRQCKKHEDEGLQGRNHNN